MSDWKPDGRYCRTCPQPQLDNLTDYRGPAGYGFLPAVDMAVGVYQEYLIVRVGAEQYATALKKKGARPFDITVKPMTGWVMVSQEDCGTKQSLEKWISTAMEFVATLPPK